MKYFYSVALIYYRIGLKHYNYKQWVLADGQSHSVIHSTLWWQQIIITSYDKSAEKNMQNVKSVLFYDEFLGI